MALPMVPKSKLASGELRSISMLLLSMKKFYLGINYLNTVKALWMPCTNTVCIIETGQPCVVPMKREINEGKMFSAF